MTKRMGTGMARTSTLPPGGHAADRVDQILRFHAFAELAVARLPSASSAARAQAAHGLTARESMPGMADTHRQNEHGADAAAESTLVRAHFVSTAAACVGLVADPHVAAVLKEPSVLADFSVGALAGHLTRGILQVEWFLDNEVPDAVPVTAAEYYAPFADTGDLTTHRNRAVLVSRKRKGSARLGGHHRRDPRMPWPYPRLTAFGRV